MATRDFHLVARINVTDESKLKTLEQSFIAFGKEVYATCVLLQGPGNSSKPSVKVFSEDMFHGRVTTEVGDEDEATKSEQPA